MKCCFILLCKCVCVCVCLWCVCMYIYIKFKIKLSQEQLTRKNPEINYDCEKDNQFCGKKAVHLSLYTSRRRREKCRYSPPHSEPCHYTKVSVQFQASAVLSLASTEQKTFHGNTKFGRIRLCLTP